MRPLFGAFRPDGKAASDAFRSQDFGLETDPGTSVQFFSPTVAAKQKSVSLPKSCGVAPPIAAGTTLFSAPDIWYPGIVAQDALRSAATAIRGRVLQ